MADEGKSSDSQPADPPPDPQSERSNRKPSLASSDARAEDSDGSSEAPSLPRSHTPGQLATGRRRQVSEPTGRNRSQSASQKPARTANSRPSTATKQIPASKSTASLGEEKQAAAVSEKQAKAARDGPKRELPVRTTSASALRASTAPPARPAGDNAPPSDDENASSSSSSSDEEDSPSTVAPAPPSGMYWSKAPVSGAAHKDLRAHTVTLVGSNIYIFGGCDASTCFNQLYVLDGDAFFWSLPKTVGDAPTPLRAMTCTAVGKKLVVFGGGDGPAYYNDVYVLDTGNFRWSKPTILSDKAPCKRRAHTACLYRNGIYVFGGGDGVRALNDIWRLDVSDTSKMSWKQVSSSGKLKPKARGYHTANIVGGNLIIFGGSDGSECFDDVWVYGLDSHRWKPVTTPVTYRRLSHTATIVGSYLFVLGGHDGNEYLNDVLLLNLVTMTWDKRRVYGIKPSGRGYHGTVLYDSRLIMMGGFDGTKVFGDVMILDLAVHSYYSQISHFTIEV